MRVVAGSIERDEARWASVERRMEPLRWACSSSLGRARVKREWQVEEAFEAVEEEGLGEAMLSRRRRERRGRAVGEWCEAKRRGEM